ncbi:hypothetical protein CQA62_05855 [Helicobacter cholecystus]|uniref:Uncharacterized protein n=1 Tax=Helicobacter cholecystus TaxID=45498 RepID=A0A3D8IUI4_9HELI|nr:GDYXXLXY domain-containing protein [Helicobacter cholecystus]RDU68626.1 hypothetical protein CQA62_05855 [Helicobacter cholecystus]VEJ24416.1 Uncharacterized membrane-anchored protein [Helicobacter cholecystus]
MLKTLKIKWPFVACVLQFALIGAMFAWAYAPIAFGVEVKVIAQGYDPKDLLAGDFVRLDYGVKSPPNFNLEDFTQGVFVCLKEAESHLFTFDEVLPKLPKNKLCIKIKPPQYHRDFIPLVEIEKYFAPKKEAQEIQNLLTNPNNRAIVTLKIFQEKARIIDLKVESIKK